jgi:hypothetical protein
MEDPAALEMAVSRVLDSLPEEHHKSACLVSNYAAAAFRGTGSVSSVTRMRTSQTALEAKVTKLEEKIHGSVASGLKGLHPSYLSNAESPAYCSIPIRA